MGLKPKRVNPSSGGNGVKNLVAELLEPANYLARLVQVIDLGLQPNDFDKDKVQHKVRLTYELTTEFMKDKDGNDVEDKPRLMSEDISFIDLPEGMTIQEIYQDQYRGKSRMVLRAKAFDAKGKYEFDFTQMIGMPCLVFVGEKARKKDGELYNVIGSVSAPMKGMSTPELVNEPTVFLIEDPDLDVFRSLPQFLQDIIKGNLEFRGSKLEAMLNGDAPEEEEKPAPKKAKKKAPEPEPEEDSEEGEEGDDNEPW